MQRKGKQAMKLYEVKFNDACIVKALNESQCELLTELGIEFALQSKYEIVESSPRATVGRLSIPLHDLKPGFSLPVAFNMATEQQLRTHVCRAAKKLGFKLRVIKHAECFEVARIA